MIKALFSGLSIIDIQMFIAKYPASNSKVKTDKLEITTGGPATNAAITCAFLGAETTLVSPVGNHYYSHSLLDSIVENNIHVIDPIEGLASQPLIASIVTDESNGERTIFSNQPQKVVSNTDFENRINLDSFSIALFDGFYPEINIPILQKLKEKQIVTVLDGGSWKPWLGKMLPYVDVAICSSDFQPPGTNNPIEVFRFLEDFGIRKCAITRGGESILVSEDLITCEIGVQKTKCIDSLGAGDVFHGAFCYFYADGKNFKHALSEAAKIASFSCTHRGTRLWTQHFQKSS
jgi:sugar/nucleoside kinase (ribokinase family)